MKRLLIILDSGHGGIIDGKYTTAPAKMHVFGDNTVAFEGVINRQVKNKLKSLLLEAGIPHIDITNTNADLPLSQRVDMANALIHTYQNTHDLLYFSIHSNAGGGTGFEVWTSPGETLSDKYASILALEIMQDFPEFPFRRGNDGDLDKEEKFYVLVHTRMPAVLAELLFFDNHNDWRVIRTQAYIERIAKTLLNFIKRSENEIIPSL